MTAIEQAEVLNDLEWVLRRAKDGTSAGAVRTLLGTPLETEALRLYPRLETLGGLGFIFIYGTREVWLDIAVQRLGQDIVTNWLLEQEE